MPTFIVKSPDGKEYEVNAPEGATQEQAIEYVKNNRDKIPVKSQSQPSAAPATTQETPPSVLEQMFGLGSPIQRFAKGFVMDPALGVVQMLANRPNVFGDTSTKEAVNRYIKKYEEETQKGRERAGSTGFDFTELVGGILSPVNKVGQAEKAATVLNRVVQGAKQGTLSGLLSPTSSADTEDQYVTSKLLQAGFGGVIGGTVPATMTGLNQAYKIISDLPLTEAAKKRALEKYVIGMVPEGEKDAVLKALQEGKEIVSGSKPTAAQALADTAAGAKLVKEQQRVSGGDSGYLLIKREQEQAAARLAELSKIARTPEEKAAIEAQRKAVTDKLREDSFKQAGYTSELVGRLESEIRDKAANLVAESNRLAAAGGPGEAGRAAGRALIEGQRASEINFKKLQLDSLESSGMYPLRVSDITTRLNAAIKGTPNDEVRAVLSNVKTKLESKADNNGMISSIDLYENVRKTLNQDILGYLQQAGKPYQGGLPEQLAKTSGNIKNFIDDAMDKASGGLWKDYLNNYVKYSEKLNRMEVGQFLVNKLQLPLKDSGLERAGVFAQAVNDAAATIKKSTGLPRYTELSQVLNESEVASVNRVLADLSRARKAEELSKAVKVGKGPLAETDAAIPQFFDSKVTVLRNVIRTLKTGSQKELDSQITNLMLNPQDLALFISAIPKQQTKTIGEAMMKRLSPNVASQLQAVFDTTNVTQGTIRSIAGEF